VGLSPEQLGERLRAAFGERVRAVAVAHGETTLEIHRDDALTIFAALRDQPEFAFDFLMDVSAVDYLGATPRFAVVYHLYSVSQNHRLRVKIRVVESDAWVHSLTGLWQSANWGERECWDMFGIRFVGHPDPRRILMYEEFVGHPLRRDYPVDKRQPLVPERDPIETGWKA
jgi:NADH-quinone oxidoreductase subunit C